ncbi:family 16 glycosylhydrolase [Persicobacter diffluens]|uniref:GH16 domain-containing protein n=1 Tax=Persicobacter diffluens TaxID=981 RepID=A0AAN5AMZ0_9BACT|nr:hypothetical protein PEDI_48390 [Persicobacter diffluens]
MRRSLFFKSTLWAILSLCKLETFGQHVPLSDPENNANWILNENLSDEFNGEELDKTKWWILGENNDYRSKWKGRAPGQFAPHNVKVENGELVLISRWDPDFNYDHSKNNDVYYGGTKEAADKSWPITQACIMSESFFRYGYMEIRCKAADAPVTAAFWTTGYQSEIDMIENFGKLPIGNPEKKPETLERKYRTNLISWDPDKSKDHKNYKVEDVLEQRVADDYFVYGFEWDKNYIKTYFNGKLVRHATREELEAKNQWKYDVPQELWLNSEVFSWYGLPTEKDLAQPAAFKVDYVRIWQKEITGPEFAALDFEGPFHYQGRSTNWWAPKNSWWRMKNEKAASGEMSLRFKPEAPFKGAYSAFSPYGAIDLPAGDNEVKFKIWIDPETKIKEMNLILNAPFTKIPVNLSKIKKGEWVEVSRTFKHPRASVTGLDKNADRLQIMIPADQIKSREALLYIDDISFGKMNTPF